MFFFPLLLLRYYFKVQAKNVFGYGPISETLTYVTESGASSGSASLPAGLLLCRLPLSEALYWVLC